VRLAVFDPEKDADAMAKWNLDSEYSRLLGAEPAYMWTPKQIKDFLEKEKDVFFFIIHDLADDRPIGLIDLSGFNWSARHAWVGIGLGEREFWGKGYGSDAMRVLLRYAFAELNLNRVNLNVFEYNERAYKSYLKCGFVEEGRTRQAMLREGRRWDMIFMGILKSEWEAANPQTP
jgi:RimJ/RimL family protein N-acetyltransferase